MGLVAVGIGDLTKVVRLAPDRRRKPATSAHVGPETTSTRSHPDGPASVDPCGPASEDPSLTSSPLSDRSTIASARRANDDRLERLRAGDPDAIRDCLREMLPHIRRWLFRLLGHSPDLDDATQDALTELARFLPRFEGRSRLGTAAHRITVRVAYRYFHSATSIALELVPEPVDPATSADARLLAREALARLQRCLRRLPVKRRTAFVLCAIDGLSPAEAATVVGTTSLVMRCRLTWARREVARMLRGDPYVELWLGKDRS